MIRSLPLAELLRRYRAEAHVSQEELAERAGVAARTIGDIETGVSLWPRAITISLISEALGLDAQSRETLRAASSRRGLKSSSELPHAPPLIGRETDMAAVLALLRDDAVRLVTLTGGPGVGKTALAAVSARELRPEFGDRIRLIDFAALTDPVLVPTKVSLAVGVRDVRGDSVTASIAAAIAGRPMLMIMDNFERVVPAAPFVAELIAAAPQLKILVASRTRLRLTAERALTLGSLTTESATALLLQRVRAHVPDFEFLDTQAAAVAMLARTLGGVPLAIELAAPLLRTASATELVTRLEHPLDLLVTHDRRTPQRQRTMRDAIAWSYALLAPSEQRLFRRLAVFNAHFTEDAVQQIASDDDSPADALATLRALAMLLDHNLVASSDDTSEETEFELHPLVNEFANELLERDGERDAAYLRFCEYSLHVAQAPPRPEPSHDRATRVRLNRESSHFDTALGWLKATGQLDRALSLAVTIWPIWYRRGENAHGYAWLTSLLADPNARSLSDTALADAHWAASGLSQESGQFDRSEEHIVAALPAKRAAGDRGAVASLLAGMGVCAQVKGDYSTARRFYEESLAIRRELGDGLNVARTLIDFGMFASDQGKFAEATQHLDEALVLFRAAGRRMGLSLVLGSLALVAVRSGTPTHGELLAREAIQLAESVGFTESARTAKIILSRALLALGDVDQADTLARSVGAVDEMAPALPGAIARVLAAIAFERAQPRFAARLLGAASTDSATVPPADRASLDKLAASLTVSLGAEFDAEYAYGRDRGGRAVLAASELRE
jgi:predicted ATPase/DNA-binding XRE family transcriptional regulator